MTEQNTQIETTPQRPDLNVEAIEPGKSILLTPEQLPWITKNEIVVPTVLVHTTEGLTFRYGSTVGAHSSVERLAHQVQPPQSISAERTMFKSLPFLFKGKKPPHIDHVSDINAAWPVSKVAKVGADAPRLFFTWFNDDKNQPVVLKLAIAGHKKQDELLGVLRHTSVRRHKDGRSR